MLGRGSSARVRRTSFEELLALYRHTDRLKIQCVGDFLLFHRPSDHEKSPTDLIMRVGPGATRRTPRRTSAGQHQLVVLC
jgi:hypothetical protein